MTTIPLTPRNAPLTPTRIVEALCLLGEVPA